MNFQRSALYNIISVINITWNAVECNPGYTINFALRFEVRQALPLNIIPQFVNHQSMVTIWLDYNYARMKYFSFWEKRNLRARRLPFLLLVYFFKSFINFPFCKSNSKVCLFFFLLRGRGNFTGSFLSHSRQPANEI